MDGSGLRALSTLCPLHTEEPPLLGFALTPCSPLLLLMLPILLLPPLLLCTSLIVCRLWGRRSGVGAGKGDLRQSVSSSPASGATSFHPVRSSLQMPAASHEPTHGSLKEHLFLRLRSQHFMPALQPCRGYTQHTHTGASGQLSHATMCQGHIGSLTREFWEQRLTGGGGAQRAAPQAGMRQTGAPGSG